MKRVVVDTGVIYAMADSGDNWHKRVMDCFDSGEALRLVLPATVIPEACYLLNSNLGVEAEQAFIKSIAAGEFLLENVTLDDLKKSSALLKKYADINIGLVDATVAVIAERLGVNCILTTDRRHFSLLRKKDGKPFELLP